MSEDIIQQLKATALFRELNDEALATIAKEASTRKLTKDEVLMKKGDAGDSLFLVNAGEMKIVTEDSKGDELIINKCGPGEIIGEMALIDGVPRSATVIALNNVKVLELKHDVFEKILETRPDVSLSIIRNYSSRLRFSTTYIEKAIDWAQMIAEGDYSFIDNAQHVDDKDAADKDKPSSDDDKAVQLLAAFFAMVRKVKEREDDLKEELERLNFEIDQARRKKEFEEITGTEFYVQLKEQAKELRKKRSQD